MSVDRYIAVCHSFSAKMKKLRKPFAAFVVIVVVWTFSVAASYKVKHYAVLKGEEPNCKCE